MIIDKPSEAMAFETAHEANAAMERLWRLLASLSPDEPRPFGAPPGMVADVSNPDRKGVF
jgi:hypothetical protein